MPASQGRKIEKVLKLIVLLMSVVIIIVVIFAGTNPEKFKSLTKKISTKQEADKVIVFEKPAVAQSMVQVSSRPVIYIQQADKVFLSFNQENGDRPLYAFVHAERAFYLIGYISFEEGITAVNPNDTPIPETEKELWQGKLAVFSEGTNKLMQNTNSWFAIDK